MIGWWYYILLLVGAFVYALYGAYREEVSDANKPFEAQIRRWRDEGYWVHVHKFRHHRVPWSMWRISYITAHHEKYGPMVYALTEEGDNIRVGDGKVVVLDDAGKWEVYAIDLDEALFVYDGSTAEASAKELADKLDGLALRCIARPAGLSDEERIRLEAAAIALKANPSDDRTWELS